MASELDLTDGLMRVTANGATQPLAEAVDVSAFDQADLLLWVAALEGTFTGGGFQVAIIGGMSKETEDGWVTLGTFSATTTSNFAEKKNFSGLVKFLRWKIVAFNGGAVAVFGVRGMLRSN